MTHSPRPSPLRLSMLGAALCLAAAGVTPSLSLAQAACAGYGPQTPRDISAKAGANPRAFSMAPAASEMNLCNIHFHAQAEHKGPGFSIFAGATADGGYQANLTPDLTEAEKAPLPGACKAVAPGDTIEVHWVHSSCDITPGAGLGSCLSDSCANPQLRVEAQVFVAVNDAAAPSFLDYAYAGNLVGGLHQAKALPTGAGVPIVFGGSTTGPSYTQATCSPLQVTWSVRPQATKISMQSLHAWCADNPFDETKAHGVRQLVTNPDLLSKID